MADISSRDTFVGAYAVLWVKEKQCGKWDLRSAVEYACKASARTIQKVGCQESIPWASDLSSVVSPD
jgi:ribokinase